MTDEGTRPPGVRCRNVVKEYGRGESRVRALRGIDLDLAPGELTLLVGPSGCGKTTLISILAAGSSYPRIRSSATAPRTNARQPSAGLGWRRPNSSRSPRSWATASTDAPLSRVAVTVTQAVTAKGIARPSL